MTRNLLRTVARGTVGALLFALMAVAAHACPTGSPVLADGTHSQAIHKAQGLDCGDSCEAMDPSAASLCAKHCKSDAQSNLASTMTVPAALLNVLYTTPLVPVRAPPPRAAAASMSALVAAAPPHTILHCVYRT